MFKIKDKWYQTAIDGGDGSADGDTSGNDEQSANNEQDQSTEAYWPSDWRENYAGEDEKKLSRLSRYTSPTAAIDAMLAAQNRINSGELKEATPFPAEGTEEQQASWRTENGLPTEAKGYDLTFDDGLVIGEADQPRIDKFLDVAHENNYSNEQVKAAIAWNQESIAKAEEEQAIVDEDLAKATTDALNAEWGQDYRGNINRIHGLLDTAPEGVKEKIMGSRTPDGTPLMSDLDSLRFLASTAMEINPATTLVPAGGGDLVNAIADEIQSIEKLMGDRSSEYYKGPMDKSGGDTVMAVRYRELVAVKEKMAAKK